MDSFFSSFIFYLCGYFLGKNEDKVDNFLNKIFDFFKRKLGKK